MIVEKPKRGQNVFLTDPQKARERALKGAAKSSARNRNKPVTLAPVNLPKEREDKP